MLGIQLVQLTRIQTTYSTALTSGVVTVGPSMIVSYYGYLHMY